MCVIVPTFLIFMFVDQLLLVDVHSQPAVLFNLSQKTTMADLRYKSLKSWKIDNIDLTQQFSRFLLSVNEKTLDCYRF